MYDVPLTHIGLGDKSLSKAAVTISSARLTDCCKVERLSRTFIYNLKTLNNGTSNQLPRGGNKRR